jgi:glycosyltransferase involved in cell wall biosynthesis
MKIGIMGTRGIPNRYGGFEQFAEQLSQALFERGHEVYVYNSSLHPYRETLFNGVNIIHCKDKEDRWGTAGQFIYDRNCINDARKRDFDVLLHLGYTSDSIWHRRWPKKALNVVNMDGLEWRRAKYNWLTKQFLKKAEDLAANHADVLIADNPAMKDYLEKKYKKTAACIPYPVTIPLPVPDSQSTNLHPACSRFMISPGEYFLMIARMEPENNLEMVIKGALQAQIKIPMVLIGHAGNDYGRLLRRKYESEQVRFLGAVYEPEVLNELRCHSLIYFHGHSVGGTNPSLLEAMACKCRIAAHDNEFNRSVLGEGGLYFLNSAGVADIIRGGGFTDQMTERNMEKIKNDYPIDKIVEKYEDLFKAGTNSGQNLIKS